MLLGALARGPPSTGLAAPATSSSSTRPTSPARSRPSITSPTVGSPGTSSPETRTTAPATSATTASRPHDERYRWAEEYVDVTYKLWEGSWDEGALLKDRERGLYADPAKVHKIYHTGERYQVEGPYLSSPSPQRTPVLFQAGASGAGRRLRRPPRRGRLPRRTERRGRPRADRRDPALAVEPGRRPEDITFHQGLSFVVGETEAEAQEKLEHYRSFVSAEGYAAHTATVDLDGRLYDPDTPLSEVKTNGAQGRLDYLLKYAAGAETTIGEAWVLQRMSGTLVGTPGQIADGLEHWQAAGVDGINVINWVIPGSFEEFADQVMPELRERGLAQAEYAEGTLRRKLFGRDRLPDSHPAATVARRLHRGPAKLGRGRGGDRGGVVAGDFRPMDGESIPLIREEEIRERVAGIFARRRAELEEVLPAARVEHVGSTAVPGSLTKGDLDICMIVAGEEFEPASRVLAERFEIHQPENWSATLASFIAPPQDGTDVGVQLVPAGSADERHFVGWRDRLRADPELRARYDELKRRHQADGIDAYRAAKERLIRTSV